MMPIHRLNCKRAITPTGARDQDNGHDEIHPAVGRKAVPEDRVLEVAGEHPWYLNPQMASKNRMMPAIPSTIAENTIQPSPVSSMVALLWGVSVRPGRRLAETSVARTVDQRQGQRSRRRAASDGCWPLITNDHHLTPAQVLTAYRYQPHLERRHHCLKAAQAVAPVPTARPRPHRRPAVLPLPGPPHPRPHRTPDPHRHDQHRQAPPSTSTPKTETAPPPARHESWTSSPITPATSTTTAGLYRSSNPTSKPASEPCCDYSPSPQAPTNTTDDTA